MSIHDRGLTLHDSGNRQAHRSHPFRIVVAATALLASSAIAFCVAADPPTNRPPPVPSDRPTNQSPPQSSHPRSTPDADFAELLDRPIRFETDGSSLKATLDALSTASGVKVQVDWKSLNDIGLGEAAPVCPLKLNGVPLRQVLRILAQAVSNEVDRIVAEPDRNARNIRIVSVEAQRSVVREYPVGDLLAAATDEDLVPLIQETVDPDTWRDNGGSMGEAAIRGEVLRVTQTLTNQEEVADLLATMRRGLTGARPKTDLAVQALGDAMDRPMDVDVDGKPLREALRMIAAAARINVFVNDHAIKAAGIDLDKPVSLARATMTPEKALAALATATETPAGVRLSWAGVGGVQWVADSDTVNPCETRCYDVRAWLNDPGSRLTFDERMEQITKRVEETIDPDSWRDNGGPVGAIRPRGYTVIVTQTPPNQRRVADLLGRKQR